MLRWAGAEVMRLLMLRLQLRLGLLQCRRERLQCRLRWRGGRGGHAICSARRLLQEGWPAGQRLGATFLLVLALSVRLMMLRLLMCVRLLLLLRQPRHLRSLLVLLMLLM